MEEDRVAGESVSAVPGSQAAYPSVFQVPLLTRRTPRKLDRSLALSGFSSEATMSLQSGSRQFPDSTRCGSVLPVGRSLEVG